MIPHPAHSDTNWRHTRAVYISWKIIQFQSGFQKRTESFKMHIVHYALCNRATLRKRVKFVRPLPHGRKFSRMIAHCKHQNAASIRISKQTRVFDQALAYLQPYKSGFQLLPCGLIQHPKIARTRYLLRFHDFFLIIISIRISEQRRIITQ